MKNSDVHFFKHALNGKGNLLPAQLNLVYCQQ